MANVREIDLSTLVGKHVFTSYSEGVGGYFQRYSETRRTKSVLLRGEVTEFRGDELKLIMAGNGSEFDGRVKVIGRGELILLPDSHDVRIEEEHGVPSSRAAGVWSEPY